MIFTQFITQDLSEDNEVHREPLRQRWEAAMIERFEEQVVRFLVLPLEFMRLGISDLKVMI